MQKIYISEPKEIHPRALKLLNHFKLIKGDPDFCTNHQSDCQILLIRSKTKIKKSILTKFPKLKHIIRVGVGLDNINFNLCQKNNIKIYNAPGSNSNAVSEYVVNILLSCTRKTNLLKNQDLIKWNRFKFLGQELNQKTIGLIGFGNVAKLVHKKLSSFGCRFLIYDPYIDYQQFSFDHTIFVKKISAVFTKASIISVHVPLTSKTHYLINSTLLNKMKNSSILINSSRGGIVNEKQILKIFPSKHCTYIADVFENEPKINKKLINHPNVICTPHIASMTVEANFAMAKNAINNFLHKKPVLST